eukprot:5207829-Lingulodinium_polyedra.AAC.1
MDATACMGIAGRRGLGKLKHVHTVSLWVQEHVTSGRVKLCKHHTSEMLADFLTKYLPDVKTLSFLKELGYEFRSSAHPLALRV